MSKVIKDKEVIISMFNSIAAKYDSACHILSFGVDKLWRKRCVKSIKNKSNIEILDIATGTGDLAIELLTLNPKRIVGIDISEQMLEIAKEKFKKHINTDVSLLIADVENMPFPDNSFDVVTIGFGIRNFENIEKAIKEIYRVLKPNGQYSIIEITLPNKSIRWLYSLYFKYILPAFAQLLTKNKKAYIYLNESVNEFPQWNDLNILFATNGFKNIKYKKLTFGTATLYVGYKNNL